VRPWIGCGYLGHSDAIATIASLAGANLIEAIDGTADCRDRSP